MKLVTSLLCIIFFLVLICCKSSHKKCSPAFYYWKSELDIPAQQREYLGSLGVNRLYIKLFDVDIIGEEPQPLAELTSRQADSLEYEVVPVVFITNRTFDQLDLPHSRQLATLVFNKIKYLSKEILKTSPGEIQMDCDWSRATRDRYFAFLTALNQLAAAEKFTLSATIRLHQVKFAGKTGIPPVARGMLMWYNTGDLADFNETNSILNDQKTQAYLTGFKSYPLPLDVVLPVFSWGVLFRETQFELLIHPLTENDLQDTTFFKPSRPHFFTTLKNGYFKGHYIYAGDEIRVESASKEQLSRAAAQIKKLLQQDTIRMAFFHLDDSTMTQYPASFIRTLF